MDADWVCGIRNFCIENGVAFHFEQWHEPVKSKTDGMLNGRRWDQMPASDSEVIRS